MAEQPENTTSPESISSSAADALAAAQAAINSLRDESAGPSAAVGQSGPAGASAGAANSASSGAASFAMPDFTAADNDEAPAGIDLLADVLLNVKIELGRTRMLVEDILKLGPGAVVELDKLAGDPVDVYVNDRHVARGEVLVLNDNFCVRINEILPPGTESAAA